jgi:regulator of replication initiation timing
MAHRQEAERKYFENMTRVKDLETENLELELELEVVKKRLSDLDPAFQKYIETFTKLAEEIKRQDESPL